MKRILLILTMAINAFFCVMVHGQTVPTEQPQRVQHPYYQYDGFIEARKGILLPRRIANFTPKSPVLIYDTVSGKVSVYFGGWKSLQNVSYTSDYNDLINRPDLTQYVPTSRTINGYSLTSNITINKVDIGLGNVQNVDVTNAGNITSGSLSDARLSANVTLQGNTFNGANQLLQLDAGGKVAYANLPASLMIYKGVWDASTNTPTLSDGSGVNGWVYRVHPGGTVNFGSGNITFLSGDYVIYNGSVWQKSGGGDAVTSVNGQQGVVVLTTANIAEGGTNYYYTNNRVQTFGDTRYSLLNHEHVYSDIANLSSYTGFDVRYKSISYVPAWSEITGKPSFATVATSGSYTDLSGTPALGSLAALSSIGNTYITDVAWSKVTGAPSFLTAESDPVYVASSWYSTTNNASNWNTAYGWGNHAGLYPTYNGTGATGTWGINISGNAATVTNGVYTTGDQNIAGSKDYTGTLSNTGMSAYSSGTRYFISIDAGTARFRYNTESQLQSWLGLGSNAYTSTAYLPLTGGTITAGNGNQLILDNTGQRFTQLSFYHNGTQKSAIWWDNNTSELVLFGGFSSGGDIKINSTSGAVTSATTITAGTYFTLGGRTNSYAYRLPDWQLYNTTGGGFVVSDYANDIFTLTSTNATLTTELNASGQGRFKGWYTSGSGLALEVGVSGGTGNMIAYNRTSNTYADINIGGFNLNLVQNGGVITVNGLFRPNTNYAADLGNSSFRFSSIYAYDANLVSAISASTFIRSGGTSSQFLKADGSVDANTYITSAVTSIAGTSNQIAVSAATGSVTVSLTNNVVIPGTITSSASYESSDRRLKRALSGTRLIGQIESLEARLYEKDGRDEYGYYAQDALKIIPTAVKQRADGYYDLSYTQVFVVKIASLEKRVSELETLLQKIYAK